ncbi:MAG: transglycosylase SLT domain-containing protein [Dokdonella sp.]
MSVALAVLGGCAMPVKPGAPDGGVAGSERPQVAVTAFHKPLLTVLPAEPVPATKSSSPWDRLRDRLEMHGCDYRSEVVGWAERYTASVPSFENSMRRSLPFLLLVVDELERRDLPGEFAMLPFVESRYEPVATLGNRAAGMWQLMPITARGNGLEVAADYDERLDPIMATRISLGLIENYSERFNDWRLANMAFNAGEFRVKKLLGDREPSSFSANELSQLSFNSTTHDHLDKLLALACIVDDPGRFGVHLPEPSSDDRLVEVELSAPLDLRVASRIADVDEETMLRYNAVWRGNRMSGPPPYRLVLPANRSERLHEGLAQVPEQHWANWRAVHTRKPSDWATLAAASELPPDWLATLNGRDPDAMIKSGVDLLLPGNERSIDRPTPVLSKLRSHVVKTGDTLGAIARRYGVKLSQLLRWNATTSAATLQPGDRILLAPSRNP